MGVSKCIKKECPYWDADKPDNCAHAFVEIRQCKDSVLSDSTKKDYGNSYLNELMSNGCVCGEHKRINNSFCYACYKLLPIDLQRRLYKRIGDGYEEAYDEAAKYLEREGRIE